MDAVFFITQWQRLVNKFGREMDDELKKLVSDVVRDMSEAGFKRAVDVFIGTRTTHKPPLLTEFREAAKAEQKIRFDNEVKAAAIAIRRAPEEIRRHMKDVLSKEYGAVDSVKDAFKIARIRNKLRGDNK